MKALVVFLVVIFGVHCFLNYSWRFISGAVYRQLCSATLPTQCTLRKLEWLNRARKANGSFMSCGVHWQLRRTWLWVEVVRHLCLKTLQIKLDLLLVLQCLHPYPAASNNRWARLCLIFAWLWPLVRVR